MSRYSIILPVRNGSNHLRECMTAILSQSYSDLELLILENESTDDTNAIIRSFTDQRIQVFPAGRMLGMEDNWKRALDIPKKEFMTLIGHDDVLHPDYLQVMHDLIGRHPGASLYQTHFRYIDGSGKETGKCQPMEPVQQPEKAVHHFLCGHTNLMGTGFMMRSRDYERIGGIPAYPNLLFADMELWIELARIGYLAVDSRECFSYRVHPSATTASSADAKFLSAFDRLVDYLLQLRNKDKVLAPVIERDSKVLLERYCQGITHKILRVPHKDRKTPGVSAVIDLFREYGKKLGSPGFEPLNIKAIRMGKTIDDSRLLHAVFLLFKKMYGKSVLKK